MTYRAARRYGGFSGRPSMVARGHNAWASNPDNCFSRNSRDWKPEYTTLHQSHACPNPWGQQSPMRPHNVSGDPAGYNTSLWRNNTDVINALNLLGYWNGDPSAMFREFQANWNYVASNIMANNERFGSIVFKYVPVGTVIVDGRPGPQSLNALEIALENQRWSEDLSWPRVIEMMRGSGYGRKKIYNAAQR